MSLMNLKALFRLPKSDTVASPTPRKRLAYLLYGPTDRNRRLRRTLAILFFVPFVAWGVVKLLVSLVRRSTGDDQAPALAYKGMSGSFSGTVSTLFLDREVVRSILPPELTLQEREHLPDWLRERGGRHPILLIFGSMESGKRINILGQFQTVPLFSPFLEAFVGIPFLRPRAFRDPSPCLSFSRVVCSTFWPTELGILFAGWPKTHCPMAMTQHGLTQRFGIKDVDGEAFGFTAQTDLTYAEPLDANYGRFGVVASMLSQPLVLVKGRELLVMEFNLRFEAAALNAVSTSGTIWPGFFPSINEEIEFSSPKITDRDFGAFRIETTFMNRTIERKSLESDEHDTHPFSSESDCARAA